MTQEILGYFTWARWPTQDRVWCYKQNKEMRDWIARSANSRERERVTQHMLANHSLTKEEWGLSLDQLAERYPLNAPERSNQAKPQT